MSTQNLFNWNGQTGVAAATIPNSEFSSGATVQQAFDALANAGYTPDAGYGAGVATRVSQVLGMELCLTSLGLLNQPPVY